MKESILRTLVPVAVALLVRVGLKDWLGLDDATVLGLATVLVTGIYYVAVRVTERYFPAAEKQRARAMVSSIIAAFRERIDRLDWMAPATKREAKAKLAEALAKADKDKKAAIDKQVKMALADAAKAKAQESAAAPAAAAEKKPS